MLEEHSERPSWKVRNLEEPASAPLNTSSEVHARRSAASSRDSSASTRATSASRRSTPPSRASHTDSPPPQLSGAEADRFAKRSTGTNTPSSGTPRAGFPGLSISLDFLKLNRDNSPWTESSRSTSLDSNDQQRARENFLSKPSAPAPLQQSSQQQPPPLAHRHSTSSSLRNSLQFDPDSPLPSSPPSASVLSDSGDQRPQSIRRTSFFADESDPIHLPASGSPNRNPVNRREPVSAQPPGLRGSSPARWESQDPNIRRSRAASTSSAQLLGIGLAAHAPAPAGAGSFAGLDSHTSGPTTEPRFTSLDSQAQSLASFNLHEDPASLAWHHKQQQQRRQQQQALLLQSGSVSLGRSAGASAAQQRPPLLSSRPRADTVDLWRTRSEEMRSTGEPRSENTMTAGSKDDVDRRARRDSFQAGLSVQTVLSNARSVPPLSPSAAHSQQLGIGPGGDGGEGAKTATGTSATSGSGNMSSPRPVKALATMQEESPEQSVQAMLGNGSSDTSNRSTEAECAQESRRNRNSEEGLGLRSADPEYPPGLRHPRLRSTSSAAALALHGMGGSMGGLPVQQRASAANASSGLGSRDLWNASPHRGKSYSSASTAGQGAGAFSPNAEEHSHLSRYGGLLSPDRLATLALDSNAPSADESGAVAFSPTDKEISQNAASGLGFSNMSPSARDGAFQLMEGLRSGQVDQAQGNGGGGGGTESRRHSIAAAPGGFGPGQRRAVGFEVPGEQRGGAAAAFGGRSVSQVRSSSSRLTGGMGMFGSGSLAFSDEDLAADFDSLKLDLEKAADEQQQQQQHQQQQHQQHQSSGRRVTLRVPTSTAAVTGAHAASMPVFTGRGFEPSFSAASAVTGRLPQDAIGIASSYDMLSPVSPPLTSPVGGRPGEGSRKFRSMTMAGPLGPNAPDTPPHEHAHAHTHARTDSSESGARTSPTHGGDGSGSMPKYTLSPRAQAFNIGQMGAVGSARSMTGSSPQDQKNALGTQQQQQGQISPSNAFTGIAQPSGALSFFGRYPGQDDAAFGHGMMPPPQSANQQQQQSQSQLRSQTFGAGPQGSHSRTSSSSSSAGLGQTQGFYQTNASQSQQMLSALGMPQLSNYAIQSLSSLGPMPPSSGQDGPPSLQELGKGLPLHAVPREAPLYIVEFKAGRTDLFYFIQQERSEENKLTKGDLVIVEADRGKDLGTVVNDSITVDQVHQFLAHQAELARLANGRGPADSSSATRLTHSINPKRLYAKATAADTSLLYSKAQDEQRALQLCITKVTQRGLPMKVLDCEYQWDRRKLVFYYTASMRVDFRDLVRELFRIFKTRIWMMCLSSHEFGS